MTGLKRKVTSTLILVKVNKIISYKILCLCYMMLRYVLINTDYY